MVAEVRGSVLLNRYKTMKVKQGKLKMKKRSRKTMLVSDKRSRKRWMENNMATDANEEGVNDVNDILVPEREEMVDVNAENENSSMEMEFEGPNGNNDNGRNGKNDCNGMLNEIMHAVTIIQQQLRATNDRIERLETARMQIPRTDEDQPSCTPYCLPRSTNTPFVLESDTDFDTWLGILKNELRGMNLDYLVDDAVKPPNQSEREKERCTGCVNAFILSRINNTFKRYVADLKTPEEMIKKISSIARPIVSAAQFSVKRSWQLI